MTSIFISDLDLEKIKRSLGSLSTTLNAYGVKYIIISGSTIKGNSNKFSDIDIYVSLPSYRSLNKESKWTQLKEINAIIYDIVGQDQLDLSIIEELPLKVKFSVLNEGKFLFGDREKYHIDKGDVITQYLDFKPFLEKYYEYQRKGREMND